MNPKLNHWTRSWKVLNKRELLVKMSKEWRPVVRFSHDFCTITWGGYPQRPALLTWCYISAILFNMSMLISQQQQQQQSLLSQTSWGRLKMKPKRHKCHGSGTLIASLQALLSKANSSEISQCNLIHLWKRNLSGQITISTTAQYFKCEIEMCGYLFWTNKFLLCGLIL